ncbi:hypothetical protein MC885_017384, partial [Smutsia gigantea]
AIDVSEHFTQNQSRPEEITLREDYANDLLFQFGSFVEHSSGSLSEEKSLFCDHGDGFGDEGAAGEMIVELENPDGICLPDSEKMDETTLSNEEEGFTLDPIDASDIAEKRKGKKRKLLTDPVKDISIKITYEQLTSFEDTLMVLELAPPTPRLMMWKKKGGVDTLLLTPAQALTHTELKMLFTEYFLSSGFKHGRKLIQKESVREEMGSKNIVETSVIEEPNSQQELNQPKTWKDVIDGSKCSSHEDTNKNVNSEDIVEIVSLAAEKSSSMNTILTQEMESHPLELESNKMGRQYFSLMKLCRYSSRKQTAAKLYSFLVLKKQRAIELSQSAPYADIIA